MEGVTPIVRALVSVSDKTGVTEFAQVLADRGIEVISTGGTCRLLQEHGVPVTEVSEHTGSPEAMNGRVKTLHPKIHGGILGRRGTHDAEMEQHGFDPIDLVVVNLYPFERTVSRPESSFEEAVENIDIGGPTMIRAAAKNSESVAVVVDPGDYATLGEAIRREGGLTADTRHRLAAKAFAHTARYDGAIANYFGSRLSEDMEYPTTFSSQVRLIQTLRYGENPHQSAAFYGDTEIPEGCVAGSEQLSGKALSFNNIVDAEAAYECVSQFLEDTACVIVKHANPCGVACAESLESAYDMAYKTDPESAFGGIIAFNRTLDKATAEAILGRQFVEVVVVPECEPGVTEAFAAKQNVRLLRCGYPGERASGSRDFKKIRGGILVQETDAALYAELRTVTRREPGDAVMRDLLFAWRVAKYVKSNAIVYARDQMTIGVGAGQMSRVNSARIAAIKADHAGLSVAGSVMASDAFFPFRDAIDSAAREGIEAIIQPGGSMRDDEVVAACNEHGIAMVFTGMRHFRH